MVPLTLVSAVVIFLWIQSVFCSAPSEDMEGLLHIFKPQTKEKGMCGMDGSKNQKWFYTHFPKATPISLKPHPFMTHFNGRGTHSMKGQAWAI